MGLICLEMFWKIVVGNFFEIFGKFVGKLWDIGVTLALINTLGIIE